MPCKSIKELIEQYGQNWQSVVTIKEGPFNSPQGCDDQCGVCCVPTCPSNLNIFKNTQENGAVEQTLIPFENSTDITQNPSFNEYSAGGYNDWWYYGPDPNNNDSMFFSENAVIFEGQQNPLRFPKPSNWSTLDPNNFGWNNNLAIYREYNLTKMGSKPIDLTWASGYPSGTYYIEKISFQSSLNIGGAGVGAGVGINMDGGILIEGLDSVLQWGREARKIKYFQCISGVLVDKTTEAFSNASTNIVSGPNSSIIGTKVNYDYTSWGATAFCFFAVNAGNLSGTCCTMTSSNNDCSECPSDSNCYTTISSSRINDDGILNNYLGFIKNLPLYPSISSSSIESSSTLLEYKCDDTISQSGCLQVGVWHADQTCDVIECNKCDGSGNYAAQIDWNQWKIVYNGIPLTNNGIFGGISNSIQTSCTPAHPGFNATFTHNISYEVYPCNEFDNQVRISTLQTVQLMGVDINEGGDDQGPLMKYCQYVFVIKANQSLAPISATLSDGGARYNCPADENNPHPECCSDLPFGGDSCVPPTITFIPV